MAIINSVAIGRGRKSVGEITYRLVRGRTVAARRVFTNTSKTARQVNQRTWFKAVSQFISIFSSVVNAAYVKSRYGSSRNAFMKANFDNLKSFGQDGLVLDLLEDRNAYGLALELANKIGDDAASMAPDLYHGDAGVRLVSYTLEEGELGSTNDFNLVLDKGGLELVAKARELNAAYKSMSDTEVLADAVRLSVFWVDAENFGISYIGSFAAPTMQQTDLTLSGSQAIPGIEVIGHKSPAYSDEQWQSFVEEGLVPAWLPNNDGAPIVIPTFCGLPISTTTGLAIGRGVDAGGSALPNQSLWPRKLS